MAHVPSPSNSSHRQTHCHSDASCLSAWRISGKRRARYTPRRRVALHASARRIQEEEGLSLRAAADQLRVDHSIIKGPHRDRRYILNMDQMPVYFSMLKKRTLEIVGAKTVYIRTTTNDRLCGQPICSSSFYIRLTQFQRQTESGAEVALDECEPWDKANWLNIGGK